MFEGWGFRFSQGFRDSIFETDLCIIEGEIPRVVLELKTKPTTHDVIIYSQKADDDKRFAPQLVYGMVAEIGKAVTTKLLKHNRHMDFALYLGGLAEVAQVKILTLCISSYVEESKLREEIASGRYVPRVFLGKTVCV